MDARYRCFCSVLMHLQVRGASCRERVGVCEGYVIVLMHLQVRGASCPWLWNRRHDATSRTQSATGPASTPQDRPAPGADYHISLQSRQAPPTTPAPPPANSFRRHHAEKPRSKQGPKSLHASVRSPVGPRTHHQDRIPGRAATVPVQRNGSGPGSKAACTPRRQNHTEPPTVTAVGNTSEPPR